MQEKQQTENPPIQDYEELHTFMRREFGTEWRNILADKLKKANINLNRKMLAEIAEKHPAVFKKIVAAVK